MLFTYGVVAWGIAQLFPRLFISFFTPDEALATLTLPCYRIYFAVFFFMSFQNCGQNTYVALNCPKRAVFFSLFRKVILVVPLTLILPRVGFGVYGVFWAECFSQFIGGSACVLTMIVTIYRKLKKTPDGEHVAL
ncbi:MAG: hypothetical protein KBS81_04595 [Spirochaetales bacterium]|nr:hypothetical protein [Candidatus Physcosoma equi]